MFLFSQLGRRRVLTDCLGHIVPGNYAEIYYRITCPSWLKAVLTMLTKKIPYFKAVLTILT